MMVDRSVNESSYQEQHIGGGSRAVTQAPIALTRSVPSFNEIESRRRQQAAMLEDQLEGATALPKPGEYEDDSGYPSSHNPFAENEVVIAGYENVTYEPTLITPPAPLMPNDSSSAASANRREQANISQMNEVAARDALLSHVSQDHCWGLTAAREMTILDIVPSSAFQYVLETCTEKRMAAWVHEPFTGQKIDSSDAGQPPKPWDVLVVPPNPFQKGQVVVEVPHSAKVVHCHDCGTLGRRRCWSCFGNGEIRCSACNGSGRPTVEAASGEGQQPAATATAETPLGRVCYQCNGAGRRRCVVCLGPGQLPCKTCLARGQLKLSLQMTVAWRIYRSDRVVERTQVPEVLIRSVAGRCAFEEQRAAVFPINFFADEAVNHASRELLDEHRARHAASEKIIVQKQSVQMVPVYQVAYVWRNRRGFYYIYGHDHLVHFPDYPQKDCCGLGDYLPCNLL